MEWVCGLEDLDVDDRALAGGQGANLGAMLRAGLPVPGGFVVLTAAYREFVEHNGLRAEIEQIAAAANGGDLALLEQASDELRALFERGAVPPELERAITGAYERLGGRVAVRSSASAEDLPEASFAGQQESYLNVEGRAALRGAVKRCWSSLFTARALSYRATQGVGEEDVALAVVVQCLVEADAAGVLFTADPVSGRRDRMVIDAAWGLGEALVGGQVTHPTTGWSTPARARHWNDGSRTSLLLVGVVGAQAPTTYPVANLAQVMRSTYFPNANIIFDVQMRDPGAPPETTSSDGTVSSTFSSINTGWQRVENAGLMLAEGATLITMPGRLCQNGRPVPAGYDWHKYAREMAATGWEVYQAAKARDKARVAELTNGLATGCANCHSVYRDKDDRCIPDYGVTRQ